MRQTRSELLATLNWLVEAGADEAIGETAANRFAAPKVTAEPSRAPPPLRTSDVREAAASKFVDGIGSAMEIAARCQTLPELKAALESF